MVKLFTIFVLVWVTFTASPTTAQTPETTAQFYVVQPGDSLYAIVKMQFPEHRGSWLEVAEQLVELNPDAFPRGFDTPLRPGTQLRLSANLAERITADPGMAETTSPAQATDTAQSPGNRTPDKSATTADTASRDASALLGADNNAARAARIGTITITTGPVVAVDIHETRRMLTNGDQLFAGDTVHTDHSASVSLRMIDDTLYALRPRSSLAFEHYTYLSASRKGQSVITLIKGGFRARGGDLAKYDGSNVAYNTPVATIGVRGTDFGLRICSDNTCRSIDGNNSFGDGLYTGVLDGTLSITNNSGELLTGKGEFYRVENPANKPVPAPEAAVLLFTPEELAVLDAHVETAEPLSFWAWLVNFLFGN